MKKIGLVFATFVAAIVAIGVTGATAGNGNGGHSALAGSTPAWANAGNQKSAADPSSWVNFRVYLQLRNADKAAALAQAVSTPGSSYYGKFLSPAQFKQQYAPSSSDVTAVSSWLQSQGMTVAYTPSNNHYVAAEGTVAQVQAAFGTKLNNYNVDGVTLRGNASDLAVPSSLAPAVAGIVGVDQSSMLVQPANVVADSKPSAGPSAGFRNARPCSNYWAQYTTGTTKVEGVNLPAYGTDADTPFAPCGYGPQALRQAYGADQQSATGRGITVAIIDAFASPTIVQDAAQYFTNRGFPGFAAGQFTQLVAPGTYNHPEGGHFDPSGWYGEETLDVEAVHSMAPGAHVLFVGSPNNTQDMDAAMNHIVANRLADVVSNSYGFSTENLPPGYLKPFNDTLLQGALEGISILFSSGDSGDETFGTGARPTPDWPAVSPYVTSIGGTTLEAGTSLASPGTYLTEAGWGTKRSRLNCSNTPFDITKNNLFWCNSETYLYGSGGGISRIFPEPWYQQGNANANALANSYGTGFAGRVEPDIAAIGDPNTGMLIGQTQQFSTGATYDEFRIGGTSLACPVMAGAVATALEMRGSRLGLINPALYELPSAAYHDVIDTANPISVVRVDYFNSENANNGLLYSVRHSGATFTLHTTAGYDDVTGLGTPTAAFYPALASWGQ